MSDHNWNMPSLYGIHNRIGLIKDLEKVQMRATKLVPGNYYKTSQVQRETPEIKITNITVQTHSWRPD